MPDLVAANVYRYRLPLARPFHYGRHRLRERSGWLLALTIGERTGWGECAPLAGFGSGESDKGGGTCERALLAAAERWRGVAPLAESTVAGIDQRTACELARGLLQNAGAAGVVRSALETAVVDLAAQSTEVPLARWLVAAAPAEVAVNANAGAVVDDEIAVRVAEALRRAPVVKLKVGVGEWAVELERVRAIVRGMMGRSDARLRLDANGAWSREEARRALADLGGHGDVGARVEYVEQPVAAEDVEGLVELARESRVAVAADETLLVEGAAEALLAAGTSMVFVVKPALLGGPLGAMALSDRARAAGVRTVVTTALDSAIGRTMAAHVAAALSAAAPAVAHGLDTGGWLAEDVAETSGVEAGRLALPCGVGLGVAVPPATLAGPHVTRVT